MFGKSFCVLLILCGYVNSVEYNRGSLIKNISSDIQIKQNKFLQARLYKIMHTIKNNGTRIKKMGKRGIVMVDSDFDIPSEIYTYENNVDGFEKNDGSGTDEQNELAKSTEDDITPTSESQVTNISTVLTQSTAKATKLTKKTDIVTLKNTEGSGDDVSSISEEYFITKEVSIISSSTPEYDIPEKIPDACMNSTCEINDLFIFTSEERANIPEGANFTLTCKNNNQSLYDMLYWYKSNGSEYFLQTLGSNAQLHLNIPNTKLFHSGMYMCMKWMSNQTCCSIKSNLIIYEVPLYNYHLIIVGLIALAGLILCILLSVRRSIALKKYTKEFTKKHGKFKNLLQ